MTMKKIFVIFIMLNVVSTGYAQDAKRTDSQQQHNSESLNSQRTFDGLTGRIADINSLIDNLKKDIEEEYQKYSSTEMYTNEKTRDADFATLGAEMESLRILEKELNHDIDFLKNEYQAVDRIRKYYENSNIDSLFAHADLMSLQIHKNIFGVEYPKVMDNLQILLECADLLEHKYDSKKKELGRQKLKDVPPCETKEYLDGLLAVQEDITDEVDSWTKDEEHTLYSMTKLRNYLYNNYEISLEIDFPYLYNKVIENVELPIIKE